jgi:predicted RNA binding protein with dsRBD fold (UPF0201 family)
MNVTIEVSTPVHHTESEGKVKQALQNIFPLMHFSLSNGYFTGKSTDIKSLDCLKELLKSQKVRDTANMLLRESLSGDTMTFYLNKQAAFMGKVNFSEDCPQDPIAVSVSGKNLNTLISYLSPRAVER